jgi:hypothetical protein
VPCSVLSVRSTLRSNFRPPPGASDLMPSGCCPRCGRSPALQRLRPKAPGRPVAWKRAWRARPSLSLPCDEQRGCSALRVRVIIFSYRDTAARSTGSVFRRL